MSDSVTEHCNFITLEIPIYGLPANTRVAELVLLVRDLSAALEETGVFGQRDVEPSNLWSQFEVKNDA